MEWNSTQTYYTRPSPATTGVLPCFIVIKKPSIDLKNLRATVVAVQNIQACDILTLVLEIHKASGVIREDEWHEWMVLVSNSR